METIGHSINQIENYTLGEICKFLRKKENGGFNIKVEELKEILYMEYGAGAVPCELTGNPHGKMRKTYYFERFIQKEEFEILLKKHQTQKNESIKKLENAKKEYEALKNKAIAFERVLELPEMAVIEKREMKGKFGFFYENKKYNLPTYFSGYYFENPEEYDAYINASFIINKNK